MNKLTVGINQCELLFIHQPSKAVGGGVTILEALKDLSERPAFQEWVGDQVALVTPDADVVAYLNPEKLAIEVEW